MGTTASELRKQIAGTRRNRRGHRMFDESLRREVVAYTRARAAAGASQAGVAKEVSGLVVG